MLSPFATADIDSVHPTATVVLRRECRAVPAGATPGASRSCLAWTRRSGSRTSSGARWSTAAGRGSAASTDLLVDHAERYPRVTAIAIGRRRAVTLEPWSSVVRLAREVVLAANRRPGRRRPPPGARPARRAGRRHRRPAPRTRRRDRARRSAAASCAPSPSTSGSRRSSVGSGCDDCPAACTTTRSAGRASTSRPDADTMSSSRARPAAVHRLEPHELMAVVSTAPARARGGCAGRRTGRPRGTRPAASPRHPGAAPVPRDAGEEACAVVAASPRWPSSSGPGLLAGLSDDDPAGITTYSILGAEYGYELLWVLALSTVGLILFHELGARLGIVTGQGLAGLDPRALRRPLGGGCAARARGRQPRHDVRGVRGRRRRDGPRRRQPLRERAGRGARGVGARAAGAASIGSSTSC